MESLFRSFTSSSMPKRLLRYVLSRLELLDADALNLDNLDLALGRNTVFEFRDVAVRIEKLQEILSLPPAFALQKSKVTLLRITIPMDFYSSPIKVEVENVDVQLKLLPHDRPSTHMTDSAVPNAVDLAQSFLDTESSAERQKLQKALDSEAQNLTASITICEDDSVYEAAAGTGQPLSLPLFLADFLQGVLDRMQIKINGVSFQMHMETPTELGSNRLDPISLQVTLDSVEIEGLTSQPIVEGTAPRIIHKEGKRHITIGNVRAFLISEANLYTYSSQPSSMDSPSASSSSFTTKDANPREPSDIPQFMAQSQCSVMLKSDFPNPSTGEKESDESDPFIADSGHAPFRPYEDEESPATPRASIYHDFKASTQSDSDEEPAFSLASSRLNFISSPASVEITPSDSMHELPFRSTDSLSKSQSVSPSPLYSPTEDMEKSRMYTHEEAESMYMSAFSQDQLPQAMGESDSVNKVALDVSTTLTTEETEKHLASRDLQSKELAESLPQKIFQVTENEELPVIRFKSPHIPSLPGAWGEDSIAPMTTSVSASVANRVSHELAMEKSPAASYNVQGEMPKVLGDCKDYSDDSSAPEGPTKVVRKIMEFETLSVHLPTSHRHIQAHADSADEIQTQTASITLPVYSQTPGSFSEHDRQSTQPVKEALANVDNTLEIITSHIIVNFDSSIAFVLYMIMSNILRSVQSEASLKPPQVSKPKSDQPAGQFLIQIILGQLSINFLSHLDGVTSKADCHLDPASLDFRQEVLLKLSICELSVCRRELSMNPKDISAPSLETKVEIGTFRFGYANDDIISFDTGKPMSTSMRDAFLTSGHDIAVKILESPQGTRTEMESLPIALNIELQRLDETFSWFGGLSSFLSKSTSIASNMPTTIQSPGSAQPKHRSVRFDTPISSKDKSAASLNKLNVRIGGMCMDLRGNECSIVSESNAIKIVSREEGIGVACSVIRISGPYLNDSMVDPPATTDIAAVRLDFLAGPANSDLEKLLELIIPSKVKYDHTTDEIMVDTLLRQRRKGSVLRVAVDSIQIRVKNMVRLSVLPNLAKELTKLSTMAKYLPEDDRPGLLTLCSIQRINAGVDVGGMLGHIAGEIKRLQIGHITLPALVALSAEDVTVTRNRTEDLVKCAPFAASPEAPNQGPAIMVRIIGDEIEPTIKLKFRHVAVEYRVDTIMCLLGLGEDATPQDFEDNLAVSVVNLGDQTQTILSRLSQSSSQSCKSTKPTKLDVTFFNCIIGLNPLNLPSRLLIALTEAHLDLTLPQEEQMRAVLNINKASLLLVDDVSALIEDPVKVSSRRLASCTESTLVPQICAMGYVEISYISSAMAVVQTFAGEDGQQQFTIDLRDDLLVLETCADSTQTLITLVNALQPPTPRSKENKYRTDVVPVQDLLASISAEAFGRSEGEYDFDHDFAGAQEMAGSVSDASSRDDLLRIDSRHYGTDSAIEELFDASKSIFSEGSRMEDTAEGVLLTGLDPMASQGSVDSDDLVIHDDFYNSNTVAEHVAKIWNSSRNSYDSAPNTFVQRAPIKLAVHDVHVIWNLFDGYDWQHTRDVIGKAVKEIENKAFERQSRSATAQIEEEELDDGEAIGDFLFNSIYIGIPANRDPHELSKAINEGVNDTMTETESIATTAFTATTGRGVRRLHPRTKSLRLGRSKHHKITFELQGINVDMVVYEPGSGETQSSIDIRVQNLDIFDHVPTSTWRKFATYDQDHGEREMGTSMAHIEVLNVRPIPELGAAEMVLRATILPLRLHVDQDALDFITRFFEFKDDRAPVHASRSDVPFIQRAEINNVPVQLDFKPKRVDYAGLRSGHTTEFMNFIVLEQSRMVLRHVIIYGVPGFDRLGKTLNDIWMPDVKSNQLSGVIAGLAPVRSLVNIGSGFKDLVEIPIREYQKDGRIIRGISRGATAFVRTTGTEIVKLGAKLAVGTQYALLGAEEMLADKGKHEGSWDEDELGEEERKQISLYAGQPTGVIQGIRGGYRSLARDVNLARDAIIAVPGEIMESSSAAGAAKIVLKRAPTIIIRPAVGITKAISQTLMGATNTIDSQNSRRIDEKYKH